MINLAITIAVAFTVFAVVATIGAITFFSDDDE